jgi:hypothetical protein
MFTRGFIQTTAVIIGLLPILAAAECYQESVTSNQALTQIKEITDLQKFVKTTGNQQS